MTETLVIRIGLGARTGPGSARIRLHGTDHFETLFAEIATYLEAVDAFRREGHEPTWKKEVLR